jgi:glycosyltransferase involved in cell wall biosynthesis
MTIKILYVIDGLGQGGAERSLAEMLPGIVRAGITPIVAFFHRHPDSLEGVLRAQGVSLRFLPARGLVGRVASLRRLIRTERPDVIHTTLFTADLVGRLAAIGQPAVLVSSLVNSGYDPIRLQNKDIQPWKLRVVRALDGWTGRHLTTHFHAVSEPTRQAAVAALGLRPERITVIERGRSDRFAAPTAEQRARARQKFGLADSDEVVVNVGRQEYQKGQRYLLEAMEAVLRSRPRARLLIAGHPGRQSAVLGAIVERSGLRGRVLLLGHRDDVPDLLASADLFAFPSLYEGAAGALLEAMALGLPIVASRIPAIEDATEAGRNALLVERASVEPLAGAIVALLGDRERALAFGRRSREIFQERFTLDRCAARMVDFYRRIARREDPRLTIRADSPVRCE